MAERQRLGAYALCGGGRGGGGADGGDGDCEDRGGDSGGRVLLCRMSEQTLTPGTWTLPGGGLRHGEDPVDAVVRELGEETGLTGRVVGLVGVHSNVYEIGGWSIHGVRLLYRVEVTAGSLRREDDTTDDCRWFGTGDLGDLPLSPHAEFALALVNR